MTSSGFGPGPSDHATHLSDDFSQRLEAGLRRADRRRSRGMALSRWRWRALIGLPLIVAGCWTAIPWTFGIGVRALIGFASYFTVVLSIAGRGDQAFLSYLGLDALPLVVNGLLLVGVVSWLSWASRPESKNHEGEARR